MEPTTFYVYQITYKGERFYGYGISKNFYTRNRKHLRQFEKVGAVGRLSFVRECSSRFVASGIESTIKSYIPVGNLDIPAFQTENVHYSNKDKFIDLLKSFDFDQIVQTEEDDDERVRCLGLQTKHLYNQQILNILKDTEKTSNFLNDLMFLCDKYNLTDIRSLQFFLDRLTSQSFFWTNQKGPEKCFEHYFAILKRYEEKRKEHLEYMSSLDRLRNSFSI